MWLFNVKAYKELSFRIAVGNNLVKFTHLEFAKQFLVFARNNANGIGFSDRSMIVINRRSLYNRQSKLRQNFKLQYLQFLGLRT